MEESILEVEDLVVEYLVENGNNVRAVDHVDLKLYKGETIGLVGESGCGKSTLGFALLKLIRGGEIKQGKIKINGQDIAKTPEEKMNQIRGKNISMIFQASQNVLNPTQKIFNHFKDTLKAHKTWDKSSRKRIKELMLKLDIPENRLFDYAFQFSGGMQQRIVIGLSLILEPSILIADEPTTALDVLVQARILDLLSQLKDEMELSMILISHDLGVVAENVNRLAIMYAGELVEVGNSKDIFKNPKHPYTEALLQAIPDVRSKQRMKQKSIPGSPPDLKNPPKGCRFAARCEYKIDICSNPVDMVELEINNNPRQVRCLKYDAYHEGKFEKQK